MAHVEIFSDAGVSNANAASLSVAAVQVVITMVSVVLVDRAGRRMLLMLAGIGMACTCSILGASTASPTDGRVLLLHEGP